MLLPGAPRKGDSFTSTYKVNIFERIKKQKNPLSGGHPVCYYIGNLKNSLGWRICFSPLSVFLAKMKILSHSTPEPSMQKYTLQMTNKNVLSG